MPSVLVVDDNAMALELVREVLEPEGFDVLLCQDSQEALSLALKADVMILDVMMPEVSGFELLEELRENPELKGIPALMLSALDEGDDRADGPEVGADDYLEKPFHSRDLVLRGQNYRRPGAGPGSFSNWLTANVGGGKDTCPLFDRERAHQGCKVEGLPWRIHLSLSAAALMSSNGWATSISFFGILNFGSFMGFFAILWRMGTEGRALRRHSPVDPDPGGQSRYKLGY